MNRDSLAESNLHSIISWVHTAIMNLVPLLEQGEAAEFVRLLKEAGDISEFRTPLGNTLLHLAAQHPKIVFLHSLLESVATHQKLSLVNKGNSNSDTPLHFASALGLGGNVLALLKRSANIDRQNRHGQVLPR